MQYKDAINFASVFFVACPRISVVLVETKFTVVFNGRWGSLKAVTYCVAIGGSRPSFFLSKPFYRPPYDRSREAFTPKLGSRVRGGRAALLKVCVL